MKINPFQERAVITIRVSTSKQEKNGLSMDLQRARCEEFCEKKQWRVIDVLVDTASAKSVEHRTGIHKVLELATDRKIEHVVAWDLDRLFRNTVEGLLVFERLKELKVRTHQVDSGQEILNETPEDEFLLTMHLGLTQLERKKIAHRTRVMMRDKRKRGEVAGKIPYGKRAGREAERDNGRKVIYLETDEYEQRVIDLACEMRLKRYSFRRISRELAALGFFNRQGKPFDHKNILNWCQRRGIVVPHTNCRRQYIHSAESIRT